MGNLSLLGAAKSPWKERVSRAGGELTLCRKSAVSTKGKASNAANFCLCNYHIHRLVDHGSHDPQNLYYFTIMLS